MLLVQVNNATMKVCSTICVLVSYLSLTLAAPVLDQDVSRDVDSNSDTDTDISRSSTATTRDENWKITQKWLIESINRLQKDMNDISSSYTAHVDAAKSDSFKKERVFVHDVQILRADHTVLANQQQQIIQLIKERRLSDKAEEEANDNQKKAEKKTSAMSDDQSSNRKSHHHRRHTRRSQHVEQEKKFEANTQKNVTELFAQVSALHDITLALFHDMQDLEVRVGKKQLPED